MSEENKPNEVPPANASMPATLDEAYNAESIQHLSDVEHVRLRPGMYVGDVGTHGLHHLVYELVDNAIDEVMANYAKQIHVTINNEGSVSVEDDGRGIPVEKHPQVSAEEGRDVSTLEVVMTNLKAGGKFDKKSYKTSGGLHGIGVKAVNFLSQWCEVQVCRDGTMYQQEYERGVPMGDVRRVGATAKRGTKVTFKPDPTIFQTTKFIFDVLHKRLRELAFLNSGVRIRFVDERSGQAEDFFYERGIVEFVEHLNRASDPLHAEVVYVKGESEGVIFEVAFQYANEYTENLHSYVNNIFTPDGGTHVAGFRTAMTRSINAYGKKENIFKDLVPTGDDFREGLTAIIAVRVPQPQFQSQTKNRLNNPEVEGIVSSAFGEFLGKFLEENPKAAKAIAKKGMLAAEAREAAKKAKDLLRQRKSALSGGGLPGKLRDCISREMERCELYLVEGDSAGGSAEGGRLRDFQAILPLRGKIINAYKSREDKVLANEEVQSMIQAIGSGIGAEQDITKRRYNKIVIMTDADVDGSHIRTLLLCFFYRQMYQLVSNGHIYVAQPPLFRIRSKKETFYVQTEDEMKKRLLERGLRDASFHPTADREINGEPMKKLSLSTAAMEDALVALEKRGISLRTHAQRMDSEGRLPVFHVVLGSREQWFTTRTAMDEFVKKEEAASGNLLSVDSDGHAETPDAAAPGTTDKPAPPDKPDAIGNGQSVHLHIIELHEVRTINAGLKEIKEMGFDIQALIPQERTGIETPRFVVRCNDSEIPLKDLRGLPAAIREAGQKGWTVTRFKGLGEMNAEELRETTLDPANRTLFQVSMRDAGSADEMFRVLMGDNVEPRREFIEKHALDVKNLDV